MAKEYISEERLQQAFDNLVEAPVLDSADYLVCIKDGKIYKMKMENVFIVQE